jgi:hypothetical protein
MMLMYWPGLERDFLSLGQLEHHPHHVVRELFQLDHARLVFADRAGHRRRQVIDLDVAQSRGAAQQHLAGRALFLGQRAGLVETRIDLAAGDRAFALPAAAIAAFVGQVDVLAQAGVEQGFVEADADRLAGRREVHGRFGLGFAHALGRQPGHQEEQQGKADQAEPELHWIDPIHQGQGRHLEPVDLDVGRHHQHVGFAALADHRLDQGEHDEHQR